jgi:hypothetical protein
LSFGKDPTTSSLLQGKRGSGGREKEEEKQEERKEIPLCFASDLVCWAVLADMELLLSLDIPPTWAPGVHFPSGFNHLSQTEDCLLLMVGFFLPLKFPTNLVLP